MGDFPHGKMVIFPMEKMVIFPCLTQWSELFRELGQIPDMLEADINDSVQNGNLMGIFHSNFDGNFDGTHDGISWDS